MVCPMCGTNMIKLIWVMAKENPSYQCPECGWIIHTLKLKKKIKTLTKKS